MEVMQGLTKKLDYDEVKSYIESIGLMLLSEDYVNALTPLSCLCHCGNHFTISLNNIKKGRRCPKCSAQRLSEKNRLSFETVKNIFSSQGYLLFSEYINSRKKVKFVCPNGHIGEITLSNFKRGSRCYQCLKEMRFYSKREN
ncbi:hypothetical protein BN000_00267 [Neobacillus massiliamazoniensis]|uniref:Uncharacterized protein n=1 Tax=Neobacillus massiliamazoniensis TaxID=1499688 RepID=A0A0U1NQS7_9BACI|nr:hypothetical protein BN000_00267 [Neobacillus massiliamazoniensis]